MAQPMMAGEPNLAQRIAKERERRGWSLAKLSERLTAAGWPVDKGTLSRIEKGTDRRTIRVDHLVALATVFETGADDLLTPIEVLGRDDADRIAELVRDAMAAYFDAGRALGRALVEFRKFHEANDEAGAYLVDELGSYVRLVPRKGAPEHDSIDAATADAIYEVWEATYAESSKRFRGFIFHRGVGVVPRGAMTQADPVEASMTSRTGRVGE